MKYIVKNIEEAIDIISRKYPEIICNYVAIAEKITNETNLGKTTSEDVLKYYEGPYQQACNDIAFDGYDSKEEEAIHLTAIGEL